VTASAQKLQAMTKITFGDALLENFNEGNGYVRRGWSVKTLAGEPAKWAPPDSAHFMLNSLWANVKSNGKSVFLWEPGLFYTDYSAQVDVILPGEKFCPSTAKGSSPKIVHGVVMRAKDQDNHYRLEIERRIEGSAVRLIKRKGGQDSEIAKNDKPPALAPFDWRKNPLCSAWYSKSEKWAAGISSWRLDRVRALVKGDTLQMWINEEEVFAGGVKDADLKEGAFGLCAENLTFFDNVEVKSAK
jgi:hypothetical protein